MGMVYSLPAMLPSVFQMNVIEFHFRINAYWSILQNSLDRAIDVIFPIEVIFETVLSYILLITSQLFFAERPVEKTTILCSPSQ